ncbi:hypothetical protein N0V88_000725 [Collariella sp. IMI 366227]|nr:hypothetical protein N0V88_000725 [Collariella sp. IMI 366227]
MDLGTLFRPNISHAANGSGSNGLPDNILETLSPILGFHFNPLMRLSMHLYKIVGNYIGIDPTYILTSVAVVWAAIKLWHQVYSTVNSLVCRHFRASIYISGGDDISLHLLKWLAQHPSLTNSRFLQAETVLEDPRKDEDEPQFNITRVAPGGSKYNLNFSKQKVRVSPQFTPAAAGEHIIWFRGRPFILRRTPLLDPTANTSEMPQEKEYLVPIKQLFQHAKEQYYHDHQEMTIVKRPIGHFMRRYGGNLWRDIVSRPVRPMTTVVLDNKQKARVISDMEEFLLSGTARFYSNRGIPLRRGYLFHGPPGTGKTSLSFALAGVFGLDIYVISLSEHTLTDDDLLSLFLALPRRCIVLLEDIDTAGLKRDEDPAADSSNGKPRISLSGLLNAIDGVASQEGRVLIMTTNEPERLDKALIRPGRVDLQVAFTNVTEEEARKLFKRMYEPDRIPRQKSSMDPSELEDLAKQFASKIPLGEFSPAELLGFLLMRKNIPQNAVTEVESWVREMQNEKEVGAKRSQ